MVRASSLSIEGIFPLAPAGLGGGFSAPVVLARILEGTQQPGSLAQALDPRTTCRDVACYVSTLGEAFNSLPTTQQDQIRHRWGSHFNEILSLSREMDAELFYEALFHLGQRLEREGHTEQAGLIYSSLLPSPLTPLSSVPQTIQQQAQERITVLNGGGSIGNQMEHMGRGFARSALDPGLLLGATGMGLFGKGVELIGMRYLAGANFFRSASGIARTAIEFAPRATGFALEATAFPFAINGANELLGRSVSWAHMDHRILGSWFFLGGMRVGGGFGRMASQRFGIAGLQPLGSIAGVGLGHGGEVLAGLKDWHGFSNFAVETFGTWANLQVAGRFSEYVFGGQISRMQRVMDLSIEGGKRGRGEEGKRRGFGEWVDSISEGFNNLSGPTPLAATAAAGYFPSPSRRLFPSSPRSRLLQEGKSFMTAAGGGGEGDGRSQGPKTTGPIKTSPFGVRAIPEGSDPYRVNHPLQILRRIADEELGFMRELAAGHMTFKYETEFPQGMEGSVENILAVLNSKTKDLPTSPDPQHPDQVVLPFARRVTIRSLVNGERYVMARGLNKVFSLVATPSRSNVVITEEVELYQELPEERTAPAIIPPSSRKTGEAPRDSLVEMPQVTAQPERLSFLIRTALLSQKQGNLSYPIILEETPLTLSDLTQASRDSAEGLDSGKVRIVVPQSKRNYSGDIVGGELVWSEEISPWQRAQGQLLFREVLLRSPEEAYIQIASYGRSKQRASDAENVFRYLGEPINAESLAAFLIQTLNYYRIRGRSLLVNFPEGGGESVMLRGQDGRWTKVSSTTVPSITMTPNIDITGDETPLQTLPETSATRIPRRNLSAGSRAASPVSTALPVVYNLRIESLPRLLRQVHESGSEEEGPRNLILEPMDRNRPLEEITVNRLNELTAPLGKEFPDQTSFRLFFSQEAKAFIGRVQEEDLVWTEVPAINWTPTAERALSGAVAIGTPTDLYLFLEALPTHRKGRWQGVESETLDQREYTIRLQGPLPEPREVDFGTFVHRGLLMNEVRGKKMTIHFESGEPSMVFDTLRELWLRPEASHSASGRGISSEETPSAASVFARSRALLAEGRQIVITSATDLLDRLRQAVESSEEIVSLSLQLPRPLSFSDLQGLCPLLGNLAADRKIIVEDPAGGRTYIYERIGEKVDLREVPRGTTTE